MHIMRYLTNHLSKVYKSIKHSVFAKVANRNLWDVKFKGKSSSKRNSVLKDKTKAFLHKALYCLLDQNQDVVSGSDITPCIKIDKPLVTC